MRICVFGGSTVWGAWDKEQGGWVNRLRLFCDEDYKGDVEVYNLGVSGDTTTDILARFDVEAAARKPDVILLACGMNDAAFLESQNNFRVDQLQFEENVTELLSRAKQLTNSVVAMGLQQVDEARTRPVAWDKDLHYVNRYVDMFDKKLQMISLKRKVQYMRMLTVLHHTDLADGLHPSAKGHQKIFEAVRDFLRL